MERMAEFYGYEPVPLDADLGLTIRMLGTKRVHMYKSMPGLFLDSKGNEISGELAAEAGFDVVALRKEARVQAEIKAATARILAAQKQAEIEVRARLDAEVAEATPKNAITGELADQLIEKRTQDGKPRATRDFELVHMGAGLWQVQSRAEDRKVVSPRLVEPEAIQAMLEAQIELETQPD